MPGEVKYSVLYLRFYELKKNKKSEFLYLQVRTFSASFSQIGQKKWMSALIGSCCEIASYK
jgi:hypothetical protein